MYLEIDVAEVVIVASPQKQMNRYLDDLMEKTMIYYSPKKKKPKPYPIQILFFIRVGLTKQMHFNC